jgi:hypothetical protein
MKSGRPPGTRKRACWVTFERRHGTAFYQLDAKGSLVRMGGRLWPHHVDRRVPTVLPPMPLLLAKHPLPLKAILGPPDPSPMPLAHLRNPPTRLAKWKNLTKSLSVSLSRMQCGREWERFLLPEPKVISP